MNATTRRATIRSVLKTHSLTIFDVTFAHRDNETADRFSLPFIASCIEEARAAAAHVCGNASIPIVITTISRRRETPPCNLAYVRKYLKPE